MLRLRRTRRGFDRVQESARGTSPRDGGVDAEEHPAIETRRLGLFAEHNFLRRCWDFVHCVWNIPTQLAGIAGCRLCDDRARFALGGSGELFGK